MPTFRFAAEVIFFLFKIADSFLEPTTRLYLYKTVSELESGEERPTQRLAAYYLTGYKVLVNLPAVLLGLFCGAWSDRIGRRLPLMLSCYGTILTCLLLLASLPCQPDIRSVLILLAGGLRGGFGKSAVVTMALHSYISDVSDLASRTKRLGRLLAMNYFGYALGSLLVGVFLRNANLMGIFSFVIMISAVCVFLAIFCMEESLDTTLAPPDTPPRDESDTASLCLYDTYQPFRWQNIKDSLQVLTTSRKGGLRCRIVTLFCVMLLSQLCKSGEVDVTLLYVEREPFDWPDSWYGYLLAVDYASMGLILVTMLPCLTKQVKANDICLVFIGLIFKCARLLVLAFSNSSFLVYFAAILGSPLSLIISGTKSMISKSVDEGEVGKIFSLLSCGETIANLFGSVIFNNIFAATADSLFPGFAFIADCVVHFILLFIMCTLVTDKDLYK